jgi:hypothetical protein
MNDRMIEIEVMGRYSDLFDVRMMSLDGSEVEVLGSLHDSLTSMT